MVRTVTVLICTDRYLYGTQRDRASQATCVLSENEHNNQRDQPASSQQPAADRERERGKFNLPFLQKFLEWIGITNFVLGIIDYLSQYHPSQFFIFPTEYLFSIQPFPKAAIYFRMNKFLLIILFLLSPYEVSAFVISSGKKSSPLHMCPGGTF